jgi:hypothetical protein
MEAEYPPACCRADENSAIRNKQSSSVRTGHKHGVSDALPVRCPPRISAIRNGHWKPAPGYYAALIARGRSLLMHMLDTHITGPTVWTGADFPTKADLTVTFNPAQLQEFDDLLGALHATNHSVETIEREHAGLPLTAPLLADMREELKSGRGLVLLRGLDVMRHTKEDMGLIFWAMGTHLGRSVSQSVMGDRLGHVRDMTRTDPHARAYRNRDELTPHTDSSDIVGLCCLRNGKTGGESIITSISAVHNELQASNPEFLEVLYRGFRYHRRGEQPPGVDPITPHRIPVFSYVDGQLSCRYLRSHIEAAARELGQPLTALERAALDCLERLTLDLAVRFTMEPGEIYFINNYIVLHARTGFTDYEEEDRRRHLLRLWLYAPDWRALDPNLEMYPESEGRGGVMPQPGKTPSYAGWNRAAAE